MGCAVFMQRTWRYRSSARTRSHFHAGLEAQLAVKILPVRHHCENCGHDFNATGAELPCPDCGCPRTRRIGGEELRVVDMQLDDTA